MQLPQNSPCVENLYYLYSEQVLTTDNGGETRNKASIVQVGTHSSTMERIGEGNGFEIHVNEVCVHSLPEKADLCTRECNFRSPVLRTNVTTIANVPENAEESSFVARRLLLCSCGVSGEGLGEILSGTSGSWLTHPSHTPNHHVAISFALGRHRTSLRNDHLPEGSNRPPTNKQATDLLDGQWNDVAALAVPPNHGSARATCSHPLSTPRERERERALAAL